MGNCSSSDSKTAVLLNVQPELNSRHTVKVEGTDTLVYPSLPPLKHLQHHGRQQWGGSLQLGTPLDSGFEEDDILMFEAEETRTGKGPRQLRIRLQETKTVFDSAKNSHSLRLLLENGHKLKSTEVEEALRNFQERPPEAASLRAEGRMPLMYTCYLCGRQYGSQSLFIHIPNCQQKWLQQEMAKPKRERRPLPNMPPEVMEGRLPTIPAEIEAFNDRMYDQFNTVSLVACPICARTFTPEAFVKHSHVCTPHHPGGPLGMPAFGRAASRSTSLDGAWAGLSDKQERIARRGSRPADTQGSRLDRMSNSGWTDAGSRPQNSLDTALLLGRQDRGAQRSNKAVNSQSAPLQAADEEDCEGLERQGSVTGVELNGPGSFSRHSFSSRVGSRQGSFLQPMGRGGTRGLMRPEDVWWQPPTEDSKPLGYLCYICGRFFGSQSLFVHIPQCQRRFLQQQVEKPADERRELPPQPPEVAAGQLPTDAQGMRDFNNKMSAIWNTVSLVQCPICTRTFTEEAFQTHRRVCTYDTPGGPLGMPRGKEPPPKPVPQASDTGGWFDAQKLDTRPRGYVCYLCGQPYGSQSLFIHIPKCYEKWLRQQLLKPPAERREPPEPPPELDEVLPTAPEAVEKFNMRMIEIWNSRALVKCPYCERTMRPDALPKHSRGCTAERPMRRPIASMEGGEVLQVVSLEDEPDTLPVRPSLRLQDDRQSVSSIVTSAANDAIPLPSISARPNPASAASASATGPSMSSNMSLPALPPVSRFNLLQPTSLLADRNSNGILSRTTPTQSDAGSLNNTSSSTSSTSSSSTLQANLHVESASNFTLKSSATVLAAASQASPKPKAAAGSASQALPDSASNIQGTASSQQETASNTSNNATDRGRLSLGTLGMFGRLLKRSTTIDNSSLPSQVLSTATQASLPLQPATSVSTLPQLPPLARPVHKPQEGPVMELLDLQSFSVPAPERTQGAQQLKSKVAGKRHVSVDDISLPAASITSRLGPDAVECAYCGRMMRKELLPRHNQLCTAANPMARRGRPAADQ